MSVLIERSFTVDLAQPMTPHTLTDQLCAGDSTAHCFTVRLHRGDAPVRGVVDAAGYWLRPDGQTVLLPGRVADGNTVSVTLAEACYRAPGWCTLCIRAADGEAMTTVLVLNVLVNGSLTEALLDPEQMVPDLDMLLSRIQEMNRVTAAANAAAVSANAAARRVPDFHLDSRGDLVISIG